MPRNRGVVVMTLAVWASIALPIGVLNFCAGWSNVPEGPARAIYEFSRGLAETGRLTSEYAEQVRQEVVAASVGTSMWQDVFSLSKNGDSLPKHAPGLVLILAPVVFLFGELGPLIWQSVTSWLLLVAVVHLAEQSSGRKADFVSVFAVACATQYWTQTWHLSVDSAVAALTLGGLASMRRYPTLAGAVIGFSVFFRPSYILGLPFLALYGYRTLLRAGANRFHFIVGMGLIVVGFCLWNSILYGAPLLTSYHRTPHAVNGVLDEFSHPIAPSLSVFLSDWSSKLFGADAGLFRWNTLLLASIILLGTRRISASSSIILASLTLAVSALYIFSYQFWMATIGGNRFLFPYIMWFCAATLLQTMAYLKGSIARHLSIVRGAN